MQNCKFMLSEYALAATCIKYKQHTKQNCTNTLVLGLYCFPEMASPSCSLLSARYLHWIPNSTSDSLNFLLLFFQHVHTERSGCFILLFLLENSPISASTQWRSPFKVKKKIIRNFWNLLCTKFHANSKSQHVRVDHETDKNSCGGSGLPVKHSLILFDSFF